MIGIRHTREEYLQGMITLLVVQALLLPRHLSREAQPLVAGNAYIIRQSKPRIQRAHIGPRHHIHRSRTARIHRHIGKQSVVIEVVVQRYIMPLQRCRQQTIHTRCPTIARHIHVDGNVGTRGVIHHVGDVVIVGLRLPTGLAKQVLICQRRNQSLGFRHVHIQRGIAHIGGTVEDQRSLQHILLGQSQTSIRKDVHLLELRELQLVATAHLVIIGMTIESTCIEIRPMTAQRRVGTIHLHVAIPLMTCRGAGMKRIVVEARLAQLQIQTAANVSSGLRITVETAIQTDALQVAALHIAGHRVHLVRASIEYLHAVNGRRKAFRLHVVHHRLPSIRASTYEAHITQFTEVFVNAGHLSFHRALPSSPGFRYDDHLIKVLYPVGGHRVRQ